MRFGSKLRSYGSEQHWLDLGLLFLRVGVSATVLVRHGYPKLPALIAGSDQFFDPIGIGPTASLALAILAELLGALLVALGAFGRIPSLVLTLNFVVIVGFLHRLQIPGDRGELALLYLIAFATLFLTGPGRFTIGRWFNRDR